ncbi:MAG: hypothetical protein U5K55_12765 [Aliarcobacter sp.]|nr:hypothetical protein [Aliarcobacter sp.]
MENDLKSLSNVLENMVRIKAKQDPKGFDNEEFKEAIKSIKIGKTGYVYLIDSNGKINCSSK